MKQNRIITQFDGLSQEHLWKKLRHVDAKIAAYPPSLGGGEYLQQEREQIIDAFVDYWGYNPDNLCTIRDKNESDLNALENQSTEQ